VPESCTALSQLAGLEQVLTNEIFGGEIIVVGSLAVLFPLFVSPPPETLTLFVTDAAAFEATLTVKVNTLVLLEEITVELVQVISCGVAAFELQDQLAAFVPPGATDPAAPLLTDKPAGKVSITVIVPEVEAAPLLVTVSVYVPDEPAVKFPV